MKSLGELIEEAKDARELKRALSVQMTLSGMAVAQVGELLHVTPQYVRKWQGATRQEAATRYGWAIRGARVI